MASSLNGIQNPENGGESSKSTSVGAVDHSIYEHAINSTNWIFNVGYLHQDWADVHLTFFQSGLKAHRIILARSPYLSNIMRNVVPGSTIHLNFADENITQESVHIALQHLYNPSHNLATPTNAKSILATAYLLGGMTELVHHSYEIIRSSIGAENIIETIQWLSQPGDILSNGFRNGNGNGASTPSGHSQVSTSTTTRESWVGDESENRYGDWTAKLKKDLNEYLLHRLPEQFSTSNQTLTQSSEIISIFSKLPYELFKSTLESKELPITSMQERFSFTKKIIAQRKKQSQLNSSSTPGAAAGTGTGMGTGMEESVVLAFKGGDQGMEIHISRKPKKSRQLWKVES
ncbi:uncharacterized protein I303_102709 [Kwoniella dejecticola CBS 10117]|uniref:BTB domain-containing protein n=1 Tax=Kwoniella dejecticola CBS 10117 TaxID=1296121 RepID=A0A1A6A9H0_9TREE|nr:uncharacterized protein I303_02724 [Kwoniella dejecticola CBS 10117]OBR86712.1 hypothetical protein I303_02724 [Kwoniella dejecticola CBS 10117]